MAHFFLNSPFTSPLFPSSFLSITLLYFIYNLSHTNEPWGPTPIPQRLHPRAILATYAMHMKMFYRMKRGAMKPHCSDLHLPITKKEITHIAHPSQQRKILSRKGCYASIMLDWEYEDVYLCSRILRLHRNAHVIRVQQLAVSLAGSILTEFTMQVSHRVCNEPSLRLSVVVGIQRDITKATSGDM